MRFCLWARVVAEKNKQVSTSLGLEQLPYSWVLLLVPLTLLLVCLLCAFICNRDTDALLKTLGSFVVISPSSRNLLQYFEWKMLVWGKGNTWYITCSHKHLFTRKYFFFPLLVTFYTLFVGCPFHAKLCMPTFGNRALGKWSACSVLQALLPLQLDTLFTDPFCLTWQLLLLAVVSQKKEWGRSCSTPERAWLYFHRYF